MTALWAVVAGVGVAAAVSTGTGWFWLMAAGATGAAGAYQLGRWKRRQAQRHTH